LQLSGKQPLVTAALLAAFAAIAAGIGFAAGRKWGAPITENMRRGLRASSQLPVRVTMLLLLALALLATQFGVDVLLAGFAAGLIVRTALAGRKETPETEAFEGKLEAIGFGLFVPIFFIVSGAKLDLASFGGHPLALAAIPLYVVLILAIRAIPTLLVYRRVVPSRQRAALAFMSATGLSLIVVITTIGTANGYVAGQTAAALVTAGAVTVLVFPALAVRLLSRTSATGDGPR
jgi:Kef-type K+ transport system membrane component KefB